MKKKLFPALAAVAVMVCLLATTAFATGYTTSSAVYMRSGSSTEYAIVCTVPQGASIEVDYVTDGWAHATWNGCTGFIYSDYINGMGAASGSYTPDVQPSGQASGLTLYATTGVNLRTGPSTDYGVICVVPQGGAMTYLGESFGWYLVSYNGNQGYIYSSYASTSRTAAPSTGKTVTSPVGATFYTTAAVNLRTGPSTDYAVVCVVPSGSAVTAMTGENGGWYMVSYNGTQGYLSAKYLTSSVVSGGTATTGGSAANTWYGGKNYANVYSYNDYRAYNPDLVAAFGNNADSYLQHFVNYGMSEGRQGIRSFNVYQYRNMHPVLEQRFGDNLKMYYLYACGLA